MGNSKRIVSGSDDVEIGTWDGDSDRLVRKLCGHEGAIFSVSVSDDNLFSGSKDKTLRVWDLDTGDNISIICGHTAPINSIKVSVILRDASMEVFMSRKTHFSVLCANKWLSVQ